MTRTRSSQRHGVTEQGQPARDEVLNRVMLCLMEPIVSGRLRRGLAISRESQALVWASVESWARTGEERDDLLAQAWELAEDSVDREWSDIEPLARAAGGIAFRDLSTSPEQLFGLRTYPMPGPAMAKSEDPRPPRLGVRHRVAHGIVGAIVCGAPVSVGFSSWSLPGAAGQDAEIASQVAAMLVDILYADTGDARIHGGVDTCRCVGVVIRSILAHVGVAGSDVDAAPARMRSERLRAVAGENEYLDHYLVLESDAYSLVVRAIESGFLDHEADRLERLGRIVVEPVAAASALGVQPGDPVGPTPSAHGRAPVDGADFEEALSGSRIVGRAEAAADPPPAEGAADGIAMALTTSS